MIATKKQLKTHTRDTTHHIPGGGAWAELGRSESTALGGSTGNRRGGGDDGRGRLLSIVTRIASGSGPARGWTAVLLGDVTQTPAGVKPRFKL